MRAPSSCPSSMPPQHAEQLRTVSPVAVPVLGHKVPPRIEKTGGEVVACVAALLDCGHGAIAEVGQPSEIGKADLREPEPAPAPAEQPPADFVPRNDEPDAPAEQL